MARAAATESRKANKRGAARLAAVQALYQMDLAGTGLNEILAEFESHWLGGDVEGAQYLPAEAAFFRDIVGGVVREQTRLDPQIDAALARGWPLKRIEAVLRAVLRAGAYELACRRDVPARVVMSEYVDVASAFVDKDETGMVNAVLDQLARRAARRRIRAQLSPAREWQCRRAAEIRRRIPGDFIDGEVIVRHALQKAPHGDFGDQPRHLAAEAKMLAGTEAQMPLRPAVDIEPVGIGKFPPVAIARAKRQRDFVARMDGLAMQRRYRAWRRV